MEISNFIDAFKQKSEADNFLDALKNNPEKVIEWCESEIKEYKKLIKLIRMGHEEL